MPEFRPGLGRDSLIAGAGSLCSRVLGFGRDAVLAWLFGASGTADALATALRLPYLVRRLYGEGALSLELTVHCVRARRGGDSGDDLRLALGVGRYILIRGLILLPLCLIAARPIILLAAPGLADTPAILAEASVLFRICLPYIPAVCLAAVCMAVLHGRGSFALPALTPSLFNLIVLLFAGAAFLGAAEPALLVAAGVLCGGLAQGAILLSSVRRLARRHPPLRPPEPAAIRAVARGLPLGLLGAAAPQLIFLGAAALSSLTPHPSLAALFYAERLLEFPLGVCGAAVGMAVAPRLAEAATGSGTDAGHAAIREPLARALTLTWLCNLPAAAGLMAVSLPLTLVLFGHGAFDTEAVRATSLLLCAYAPGLPAYAASRPLLAACHALEDRRTPVYALGAGLVASLAAGSGLMAWGPIGPPLGASIGLWCYVLVLGLGVRRTCGDLKLSWRSLGPILAGSLLTYHAAAWLAEIASGPVTALLLSVPGGVGVYGLTVCALSARIRARLWDGIRAGVSHFVI